MTNQFRMIAIDPGETTGVVRAVLTGARSYAIYDIAQVKWAERFKVLKALITDVKFRPSVIITESFRLYQHAATHLVNNTFPAVRVIGSVEAYAESAGIPLEFQTPATRKNVEIPFEDKQMLSGFKHATDAYLHLRYWVLLNGKKHI